MKKILLIFIFAFIVSGCYAQNQKFPDGVYLNLKQLREHVPAYNINLKIVERTSAGVFFSGGNDFKFQSDNDSINKEYIKYKIYAYVKNDSIFLNCLYQGKYTWYSLSLTHGNYLVYKAVITRDQGNNYIGTGAVGSGISALEREMYVLSLRTGNVKKFNKEYVMARLSEKDSLLVKFRKENDPDSETVLLKYIDLLNESIPINSENPNFKPAIYSDSLYYRLQAISNNGVDYYNVDGFEITCQVSGKDFSKKTILNNFKIFSNNESDLNSSDTTLSFKNYVVTKSHEICNGTVQKNSFYFIQNQDRKTAAICFTSINKTDKIFERKMVEAIVNKTIPKTVFTPTEIDVINFAGRKIQLSNNCHWTEINDVQCPGNGEMNWSVHKDFDDAKQSALNQYNVLKTIKKGKIISETEEDVIFEGSMVKAKKVIFDFTGITSILVGMTGGKTLTIYFVAAPVRNNYVSCVLSFWNNDRIDDGGLPILLEQVMKLEK